MSMWVRRIAGRREVAAFVVEGAEAEDAAEEGPAEGYIGYEDGGGELADVPV